jgi:hypothetical protein
MPEQQPANAPSGLDLRAVGWGGVIIGGGIAFALLASYGAYRALGTERHPEPMTVAGPVLQAQPQVDRAAYFRGKEERLHSYGWVDRKQGVAHIPVEQAMRMLAAQQAPAPEPQPTAQQDAQFEMRQGVPQEGLAGTQQEARQEGPDRARRSAHASGAAQERPHAPRARTRQQKKQEAGR